MSQYCFWVIKSPKKNIRDLHTVTVNGKVNIIWAVGVKMNGKRARKFIPIITINKEINNRGLNIVLLGYIDNLISPNKNIFTFALIKPRDLIFFF